MKLLCLANSFKEGGRCLAGIQLDQTDKPLFRNNRPAWIRPVGNNDSGNIPGFLCRKVSLLDVIEIDAMHSSADGYQSENTPFDIDSIRIIGKQNSVRLEQLCDNDRIPLIFGSRGKAVSERIVQNIKYSLMLIKITNFEVVQKLDNDRNRPQARLVFTYNKNLYDLPITDPDFLYAYEKDTTILNGIGDMFVVLSLGVSFNDWYYKLAAALIY